MDTIGGLGKVMTGFRRKPKAIIGNTKEGHPIRQCILELLLSCWNKILYNNPLLQVHY